MKFHPDSIRGKAYAGVPAALHSPLVGLSPQMDARTTHPLGQSPGELDRHDLNPLA
jgi:hypothetical protein